MAYPEHPLVLALPLVAQLLLLQTGVHQLCHDTAYTKSGHLLVTDSCDVPKSAKLGTWPPVPNGPAPSLFRGLTQKHPEPTNDLVGCARPALTSDTTPEAVWP